ncbi:MAG TPA: sialidase family protein, partial [Kofleriaceae bacterium]|nr:sialidase family protein [Kofleriaceae bacterium]
VAWVDHRDKDVHFQRFDAAGPRGARINVSRTPDVFSWLPRIVLAGDDVFVVWQEIVFSGGAHGGDIFFARSRDRGVTFAAPVNLSRSIGGDGKARYDEKRWHNGSLDLARSPSGALHVAWTDYDGALWYATAADAETFGAPVQVAGTRATPARAPALAAVEDTVYLAWTVGETDTADVSVMALRRGAWSAPVVVATTATYSDAPKLDVDDTGTVHVVFAETSGGPFEPARVVYTRSTDGARTFAPLRTISTDDAGFPSLAIDGARVVVLWEPTRDPRGVSGAQSHDRGAQFRAFDVPHGRDADGGINGSHQVRLMRRLAVRDGSIAIAMSALAHGTGSRVWLIRGRLSR